jgi:uncharacterized membrane protein
VNPPSVSTRIAGGVAAAVLLAIAPAVDAAKTKPPQKKGATYKGVTSQGKSSCRSGGENEQPCNVVATVSKDGKRIATELLLFKSECADGKTFRSSTAFKRLAIRKGKYSTEARYGETLGSGDVAKNTVTAHGTFKRNGKKRTLEGDFSIESDVKFTDGSKTHCASGQVTFTAKAK